MRPPEQEPSGLLEWLRYADADLDVAQDLVALGRHELAICFHSQQAAEKALKGYLAALSVNPIPKTHALHLLADLIVEHGGTEPPRDPLDELLDYGVMPRYPGSRPLTLEDAGNAVQQAQIVVDFVREAVGLTEDPPEQS